MILPNFFVIGAPKAGTTALYDTLKQHPGIYMSPIKEPYFFVSAGRPPVFPGPAGAHLYRVAVWEPLKYALLFADAKGKAAVGEASPLYLRTPLAALRIKASLPHSRMIVILRQPAERAYSHYTYNRQNEVEPSPTFEEALAHEETRLKEGWFSGAYYRTNGYYHAQLSVYYAQFPREQIKVYLYEDWKDTPEAMLRDLFRFLHVDESFSPELRRSNVTLLPRSRRLHRLAKSPEGVERRLKPFLPAPVRAGVASALRCIDTSFNLAPPPPIHPETRALLTAGYREDILKLQDLIGRDLSHWLRAA